ncbi:hypothetical protein QAD02_011832 [Eretmocerus hayati]|uniref:Uncharacterized protein n=1 Tax=Eretmocerus hayati TaxID=131215 RepID=A0ACC2NZM9_9HYME|nr:hypothetical protein QAD02_011832 [Eretmocerus hayati]
MKDSKTTLKLKKLPRAHNTLKNTTKATKFPGSKKSMRPDTISLQSIEVVQIIITWVKVYTVKTSLIAPDVNPKNADKKTLKNKDSLPIDIQVILNNPKEKAAEFITEFLEKCELLI